MNVQCPRNCRAKIRWGLAGAALTTQILLTIGCSTNALREIEPTARPLASRSDLGVASDEARKMEASEDAFANPSARSFRQQTKGAAGIVTDQALLNEKQGGHLDSQIDFQDADRITAQQLQDDEHNAGRFFAFRPPTNAVRGQRKESGIRLQQPSMPAQAFQNEFDSALDTSGQLSISAIAGVRGKDHDTARWLEKIRQGEIGQAIAGWTIDSVELVSLNRFGRARVFEGKQIPSMESLQKAAVQTRSPSDLEHEALQEIGSGKSFVFAPQTESRSALLMIGLQSEASCVECHKSSENKLLGALSISFKPQTQN